MRVPFVVGQLLLQQKHFGLELVPLVQDVPQLLQGEPGPVWVLWVFDCSLLLAQRLLQTVKCITHRENQPKKRKEDRRAGRNWGYLGKILEHTRHVLIAHRLLVGNGELEVRHWASFQYICVVPPSLLPLLSIWPFQSEQTRAADTHDSCTEQRSSLILHKVLKSNWNNNCFLLLSVGKQHTCSVSSEQLGRLCWFDNTWGGGQRKPAPWCMSPDTMIQRK